jgi:hypothetical protein
VDIRLAGIEAEDDGSMPEATLASAVVALSIGPRVVVIASLETGTLLGAADACKIHA